MNEIITVAVMVYNAEKYLSKCLDSILNQDYLDLDILLVDDGSSDKSGDMCDLYATKDNRIRVIHKENEGLCVARNIAIDKMLGSYITFVDNDDWIEPNMISFLYTKAKEFDLDMASCTSIDNFESDGTINKVTRGNDKIFDAKEGILDFYGFQKFTFDAIQCKLYKKEIIKKVYFTPGRWTDDTLTTPKIINECSKLGYFEEGLYHYLVREKSMCRGEYSTKSKDKVLAYTDNIDLVRSKYPNVLKYLYHNIYASAATNYLAIKVCHYENKYEDDFNFYKTILKGYKPIFRKDKLFVDVFYILYKIPVLIDIVCVVFNNKIRKVIGV